MVNSLVMSNENRPIIVQSDRSILLETDGPKFEDARDSIAAFAELVKSPEHIHTYQAYPAFPLECRRGGHDGRRDHRPPEGVQPL